jgi:chromosome segregation ATPase
MGKLQGQLKAQTEASAKQSKEFGESLKKMQDTNGELNKSLQKLTAQNTQAAKDLQEAKDRARDLEKQLEEALKKNKGCSTVCPRYDCSDCKYSQCRLLVSMFDNLS